MGKRKGKPRPEMSVSDNAIEEYAKKHALTPATPQHTQIKPWKWKGVESCNIKLHTPEIKLEAFRQYCEHLSRGKAKQSWSLDHPTITLTWQTMDEYIANDKDGIFKSAMMEEAKARGYRYWEEFVEDCAKMATAHDTNALAMLMRNKFRWDRQEQSVNDLKAQVTVLLERFKSEPSFDPNTIDIPNQQLEKKDEK